MQANSAVEQKLSECIRQFSLCLKSQGSLLLESERLHTFRHETYDWL